MQQIDANTRIIDMTAGQLTELIRSAMSGTAAPASAPRLVRGISGLAAALGCSISTANRIKRSGVIDAAITQTGRIIMTDADLALKLFRGTRNR